MNANAIRTRNKFGLTVDEAATYTGIGRNTLRMLIKHGKLPALFIGRKNFIRTDVLEGYNTISLVCLRPDGTLVAPSAITGMCNALRKRVDGLDDFHFHQLRHTYTSKLLANGAAPKDVQELLGHSDINTTMNIYAHATRESKRNSVMLLEVATA